MADDLVENLYRTLNGFDVRFARIDERFDRMDERFDRMEDRFAASQRQFAAIGWSIAGVVTAQLIAGIVTAVVAFG